MEALRAALRLLRALAHALGGWWTIAVHFPRLSPQQQEDRVQQWAAGMLDILGIGLRIEGDPPAGGPLLLVCNHISWLDILVIHASRHCRFVSKSDVRHWPLIGRLATGAGTLYIHRDSRRDAMRVVHQMAGSLRAGEIVAVFPEGTTSDGRSLLPFHGNLIQAAISANAPVLPVALGFIDEATGARSLTPCYIDDETLIASLWRTVTGPRLCAVVRFGQPQRAQGRARREWASALHAAVADLMM